VSEPQIISIAKKEVGYREGYSNGHWNNDEKYAESMPDLKWVSDQGQPWCAVFVSWCAEKAGVRELYPRTASTDIGASWFKQRGEWSTYPAVPAQVFYGDNGDMNHTGIVYDYDADYIYTVEGNTNDSGSREGNGVYLKKRARRDSYVQGYGYPKGLVTKSADPNFKGEVKPEPKPSRLEEATDELNDALSDLSKVSPKRTKVHDIREEIEDLVNQLPK
jgi:hypothetical protein